MRRTFLLGLALLPGALAAQDAALLIGNNRYDQFDRLQGATQIVQSEDALTASGFQVFAFRNGRAATVGPALAGFADAAQGADRVIVALAGRFVTDDRQSWLLLSDASYPTLFGAGDGTRVPLEGILRVLAHHPGKALLVLGYDPRDADAFGPYLREGVAPLDLPQGVTLVTGPVDDMGDFVRQSLAEPELDLVAAARSDRLELSGFVPDTLVLVPEPGDVPVAIEIPTGPDPVADARAWAVAEAANDAAAYRAYLEAFPDGANAETAQDRIEAIIAEPFRAERIAEEALALTRNQRRDIQRALTLLEFDTRGIDGIFGRGSRAAIRSWQQENGYPQTSYLTREQVARLAGQAVRRQAELEAEAEAIRLAEERADRAFWDETGALGDEAGYRAYLDRYPDGVFAGIATQALAEIEEARRAEAAAADRTAWDKARAQNTETAYRAYLQDFPQGAFRTEAQAALALVTRGSTDAQIEAARQQEARMGLNPITARLVEAKLAELGLRPGTVDGRFDQATRRAIRGYQEARGLPVTGYLSEATVVRLLADSIGDLQGD